MRIAGIIWLEEVVEKLWRKHQVAPEEVEEVLARKPRIRKIEAGNVRGEDVYVALGSTGVGRHLIVLFIYKATHEALVTSAREMTPKEKRRYAKK